MEASLAATVAAPALDVVRHGRGPRTFVGLHGWSGSQQSFDPLLPHLPDDATLVTFDLPGFGAAADPIDWSDEAFLGPIEAVLHGLPRPVTLVGSCGGAVVALFVALRARRAVERLVMIDPFAYVPWYFRIFDLPVLGPLLYALVFMNPLGRRLTNQGLSPRRQRDVDLIEGFRDVRHGSNLRYLRWLVRHSAVDFADFRRFEGDVDIIFGARTFPAVRRSLDRWRWVWPHLRAFEMQEAGHIPVHEAAADVADVVFRPRAEEQR
jgi:pimeloyl-ACP methyl ester carboxylesterase